MKAYLDIVKQVQEQGSARDLRAGSAKGIFTANFKTDLREGFPAITVKQIPFSLVAGELLWFLSGSTNIKALKHFQFGDCNSSKKTIWDGDAERFGGAGWEDLGAVYGAQWRRWLCNQGVIAVEKPFFMETEKTEQGMYIRYNGQGMCDFENSTQLGYVDRLIYRVWNGLMRRLYISRQHNGEIMCNRWKKFETFRDDVCQLPLFYLFLRGDAVLDINYNDSKVWSKHTAQWVPNEIAAMVRYNKGSKPYYLVRNQTSVVVFSDSEAATRLDLPRDSVRKLRCGMIDHVRGWKYAGEVDMELPEGYVWRPSFYVDQIAELIDNIKENPTSNRLKVSAWNAAVTGTDDVALPPCHYGFQVFCDGEYMDLDWEQRSVDVFLGLPFNIASYGLLLHILCHLTGYKPRYLTASLRNVHIYDAHQEAVKTMLKNAVQAPPQLAMPEFKSIKDLLERYTGLDFGLTGYHHGGRIPAPLLVG